MAKLTKTQADEVQNVLRWLMKDNNGQAFDALSAFFVKYAPDQAKK